MRVLHASFSTLVPWSNVDESWLKLEFLKTATDDYHESNSRDLMVKVAKSHQSLNQLVLYFMRIAE